MVTWLDEIIEQLQTARKKNIEETRQIEKALDALDADYNSEVKTPPLTRLDSKRNILEHIQIVGKAAPSELIEEVELSVATESGLRMILRDLVKEDKLEQVEGSWPRAYQIKRNMTIVPGEGQVS